jgi:UDP-3-O-acyl-N-acetylglucosamine deacetylase
LLDYGPFAPIAPQRFSLRLSPATFLQEVASCRTFLTVTEAQQLREQGIGTHLRPADILVFGPRGPLDNRLRYADEPARHKILDLIGDLALFGEDLAGHIVAYRSGHTLNVELARRLWQGLGKNGRARSVSAQLRAA